MDGKLDPSFNTGAELRKHLRDPRRFDVGRAHGFRRASSPTGLLTKALRVAHRHICAQLTGRFQ